MSDASRSRQTPVQPLPAAARLFVVFCLVMAVLGLLAFWPPRSPAVVAWLLVWTLTCLGAGVAIVRRARYAPTFVWSLVILAGYSAGSLYRSGSLGGVGILIDVLLGVPLIWFAIRYQRHRRVDSATAAGLEPSQ